LAYLKSAAKAVWFLPPVEVVDPTTAPLAVEAIQLVGDVLWLEAWRAVREALVDLWGEDQAMAVALGKFLAAAHVGLRWLGTFEDMCGAVAAAQILSGVWPAWALPKPAPGGRR